MRLLAWTILFASLCFAPLAPAMETSLDLSVASGSGSSGRETYRRSAWGAGVTFHFGTPDHVFNDALSLGYRRVRFWGETAWERLDERYDGVLLGNTFAFGNRQIRVGPAIYVGGAAAPEAGFGLSLLARVSRHDEPDVGVTLAWMRMSEEKIMGITRDTNEFALTASLRWGAR